ncbi:hypothetical protein Moror_14953 [Moniliophthora roreri MCA 2997]|uniref:MYND-type domain-containing protein n=1 Tax=Moniliophthora roreri (strain MCA 2997) TaxID=1381753 RepID=V2XZN5_MONRO|nr:hypothetical protein Moror_14953 [Moniliophthora roreri MCA 2997]
MDTFEKRLKDLEKTFLNLQTKDEKVSALSAFLANEDKASGLPSIQYLSGCPNDSPSIPGLLNSRAKQDEAIQTFMKNHDLFDFDTSTSLIKDTKVSPTIQRLSCAFHDTQAGTFCSRTGTLSCAGCRLVRYCSKECQKQHWKRHKRDCKNVMNNKSWKPQWEVQRRKPSFIDGGPITYPQAPMSGQETFGGGVILWGNMPAINLFGAPGSPAIASETRNLSLAFAGKSSGDLRNLIKTVNSLPKDYSGQLAILLNDRNPLVTSRNALILTFLGIMDNMDEAAEYVLHLWYSIFLPMKHAFHAQIALGRHEVLKQGFRGQNVPLTQSSTLSTSFSLATIECIIANMSFNRVNPWTANNALNAVMNGPERIDYRERFYAGLKPSHRVAMEQWRRFGLLLPFSAANADFNIANPSLITPGGQLWMNDCASPLEGWEVPDVLRSGQSHGTTEEDIMGCLFFHVKDQLVEFAKRLRKFHMSITMYDQDAATLPESLPSSLRLFDRIEVSNVMDKQYLGIDKVLATWGPLLNRNRAGSAIISSFINWASNYPKARAANDDSLAAVYSRKLLKLKPNFLNPMDTMSEIITARHVAVLSGLELIYDNSVAFKKYLVHEGAEVAARKVGLRMRVKNEIVPPRWGVKIGSEWTATPPISTDEDWYNKVHLSGLNYSERLVEWVVQH